MSHVCPLSENAERFANEPAILFQGRTITWEGLYTYVISTLHHIKELGIKPGSSVVVLPQKGVEDIVVILALLKLGVQTFFLNPQSLPEDIDRACAWINPELIVSHQNIPSDVRVMTPDDLVAMESLSAFLSGDRFDDLQQESPLWYVPTSGSSGEVKWAGLSLHNFWENAKASYGKIPFAVGDVWLLSLPLFHVSGLSILVRALFAGGCIQIGTLEDSPKLKTTHISVVPTQLFRLVKDEKSLSILREFKAILLGGAPIPEGLAILCLQRGLSVFVTYGLTETASQVATTNIMDFEQTACAHVLSCCEVKIVDDEILIKGTNVSSGYVTAQGLQALPGDEGWFKTGDLGEWHGDALKVVGRKDNVFKVGGEKVSPERIENRLLSFPGILRAVVCPKEDLEWGHKPVAFLKTAEDIDHDELTEYLQEYLLKIEIPEEFLPWPEVIDENFKIKRDSFKAYL